MNDNAGMELSRLADKLYDIHIELWDIVDMKKSDDDKIVAIAARNNNRLVKLRSDCVEQIDEVIVQAIKRQKQGDKGMNETIGEIIEQLGFEKIRIHEANRESGREDETTLKCDELKEKLQCAINEIIGQNR